MKRCEHCNRLIWRKPYVVCGWRSYSPSLEIVVERRGVMHIRCWNEFNESPPDFEWPEWREVVS